MGSNPTFGAQERTLCPISVRRIALIGVVFLTLTILSGGFVLFFWSQRILPNIAVGDVSVGGLFLDDAQHELSSRFSTLEHGGVHLLIDGNAEVIRSDAIQLRLNEPETISRIWAVGHEGGIGQHLADWYSVMFSQRTITPSVSIDRSRLSSEIATIAAVYEQPKRDVRLGWDGEAFRLLTETVPGLSIHSEQLAQRIKQQLIMLRDEPIIVARERDLPQVDPAQAQDALIQANNIVSASIVLTDDGQTIPLAQADIADWIQSEARGHALASVVDTQKIRQRVAQLSETVTVAPQQARVRAEGKKVIEFIPPRAGRAVDEDALVATLVDILEHRRIHPQQSAETVSIPVVTTKPASTESTSDLGITERIGIATTTFRGSPTNRIANIKNGASFLNGALVAPGEIFSTVQTLGNIDNTTGYLPELVIKQDRTTPEFGGGLCQVSTTLFRAVLNAGLPIIERQNHSYRVPYYERDGQGNTIGPGLDATIYSPKPDFRFLNDTKSWIVIQSSIAGNTITFELFGTSDGRTATVDGPHTLSTIPPGDPIIEQTDTLPKGQKKKIDTAHPGGNAIATYTVTYPTGETKETVFKSSYRRWPARYLLGTKEETPANSVQHIDTLH